MWELPKQVHSALTRLNEAGYEAYVVGGCVRDLLMGRSPGDYDVATSALPEQTARVFAGERCIATGLQHGTLTVLLDGLSLEITTYRVDGPYADARHPDAVTFTPSLREDLARRDFTVNAMAYSPRAGLTDPFGGQADLQQGLLRCVGQPEVRFAEDALRIMRCLRFSSVLGFSIEAQTRQALLAGRDALQKVSAERLRDELLKLLCGAQARRILCDYAEVLAVFLPELRPMLGFDQKNPHHCFDVFVHSAAAVEAAPPEPLLRLAALLHDVGKPACFTVGEDGIGHFYGHAKRSAELADAICRRLRLSAADRERVVTLVARHDFRPADADSAIRRAFNRLTPEVFFDLLALERADASAHAPQDRASRLDGLDKLEQRARDLLAREDECFTLRDLAVRGDDLIALGVPKGPTVGEGLNWLLNAVINGDVPNEKTALLALYQGFAGH